ncbi:adenosylmethionine-8-amino-7-oxononanoate aminotransferase [Rhizobium leguminosarum]|uniref:Adenosylmethionine-8-amino-7-oxononanoate aminotransferase n=1 Tax=Rhizobium leguminosarum TaxID=384 RepID=A0AAE2MQC1_RHILE|nr:MULTISPECIES: adenosylmethionine--8-amino-7-oxononanoate transaminase [Rhizobium]ARM90895.1 adenosylmethionine--8-amino-7-oxononanoate transaminase [Rhizobium sp. CIAT894]MBB4293821.1 adenosylmethionine-8-amino-7-oxononanoate aminotransferase [Rhizobium leguminosarum]MBB4299482.1 adenosylmethionine-8-amino-7-oxononanoate aminotransferase [Rhizobium leguminosarum]MBB4310920.1 adenosylmethionine-8-amino-7-oxononanoate aminotransferase [Rhizobium leguminosarum]MBB4419968.1 adenosylmethionine-8
MTKSTIWHPFTQHALEAPMRRIVRTDGAHLVDEDGRAVLDAISSWWVVTHGHRHPKIMRAIQTAIDTHDQVIFAEFTHEQAETLASGLIELAPEGLKHVFYSDSGSTAVEAALKMALGFYYNQGRPRHRICVLEHSYHGDTIGTMSVGERGVFNLAYTPLLFEVERIPFPQPGAEQDSLDALEKICREGDVAAVLVEPLVLGAGGMRVYSSRVLSEMKRIAENSDTLVIADEVMTGWGRTGPLFACDAAGVRPDILCTSKGLTGGALALAATLCKAEVFDAHYSSDRKKTFFHSSSYTANPIACAAAVGNIQVWQSEPVEDRIANLTSSHRKSLARFANDDRFENVRQIGTIAAMDLKVSGDGYLAAVGPSLRRFFRARDLLIRPLGKVIYLMPPYCVTSDELDRAYDAIDEAAALVAAGKL